MTFTRSAAGVGNKHLFTGTHFTVYVESNPNKDPVREVDIAFWREFFSYAFPDFRFSFHPLGGKRHVINMANKIVSNSISNALCAIDSDYDCIFNKVIDDPRVFYTHGYGVENDILIRRNIKYIVKTILSGLSDVDEKCEFTLECIRLDYKNIISAMYKDQIAHNRGVPYLDRDKPTKDLDLSSDKLPIIFAVRDETVKKRRIRASGYKLCSNFFPSLSFGSIPSHHFFEIVYYTVMRIVKMNSQLNCSKDLFIQIIKAIIAGGGFFEDIDYEEHYLNYKKRNLKIFQN